MLWPLKFTLQKISQETTLGMKVHAFDKLFLGNNKIISASAFPIHEKGVCMCMNTSTPDLANRNLANTSLDM